MKRFLAYLLTFAMVFQVIGTGLAFADGEAPEVTLVITDPEGNQTTVALQDENKQYYDGTVSAYNDLPEGSIGVRVTEDDGTTAELIIEGDVETSEEYWGSAVDAGQHTDATINGDVTGGIAAYNQQTTDYSEKEGPDGSTVYTNETTYTPSDATITVTGDVSVQENQYEAVNAQGFSVVDVNGDVNGMVNATGSASVEIDGNVQGTSWAVISTRAELEKAISEETQDAEGNYSYHYEPTYSESLATVHVTGDVTAEDGNGIDAANDRYYTDEELLQIENQSEITVDGNLTASGDGITASGEASVNVGGDVTAGHEYEKISYWDEEGNYVEEGIPTGEMSGEGTAVTAYGSSEVHVEGDVTSEGRAIYADNEVLYAQFPNEDGTHTETRTVSANQSEITIGGDITSNYGDGIVARGQADITVGGSVSSSSAAVSVYGEANVQIAGDVESKEGSGISARPEEIENSTSTYDENGVFVDSTIDDQSTFDNAAVSVGGDVTAYGGGINAWGNAVVDVGGDVTAGHEYEYEFENYDQETGKWVKTGETETRYEGQGIAASENSQVTVGGNLTSQNTAISAWGSSSVDVTGNAVSQHGAGVQATTNSYWDYEKQENIKDENKSSVNVGGDLTAYDNGINAAGTAVISIGGNVTAGHEYEYEKQTYNPETGEMIKTGETETRYTGNGISAEDNAKVTVGGELASQGSAISAADESSVEIKGDVTSEHGAGIQAWNGSRWDDEKQKSIPVENKSTVTVGGDLTAYYDGIDAAGTAVINVGGNVTAGYEFEEMTYWDEERNYIPEGILTGRMTGTGTGISASDNAKITVGGKLVSQGSAIITTGESSVEVKGDVASEHGQGIQVRNDSYWDDEQQKSIAVENKSTITVGGDLTADKNAITSVGKSVIDVKGNVTSEAGSGIQAANNSRWDAEKQQFVTDENKSTVTVGGDLTAYGTGINAAGTSVISIGGDVTAGHEYENEVVRFDPETGKSVKTGETVTGYTGLGISASDSATVSVGGNLTSEGTAISAETYWEHSSERIENEDGTITYIYTDSRTPNQSDINVAGDVTSKHGTGVSAVGEATITVGGSLKSMYAGVLAGGDTSVTVAGNVESEYGPGISATKTSLGSTEIWTVDADGKMISGEYKTEMTETAGNVIVAGNVMAEKGTAVNMNGDSKIVILGDVTGGFTEEETEEEPEEEPEEPEEEYEPSAWEIAYAKAVDEAFSGIELKEDWSAGAVQVQLNEEENNGVLIVGGTIQANEGSVPVVLNYTTEKEAELPELPEMKIYEIAPSGGEYFDVNIYLEKEVEFSYTDEETGEETTDKMTAGRTIQLSEEDNSAVIEAIAKSIQYIIKLDAVNGTINLNGATYDEEYGLYTAHEEEEVSVTVRPDEGYSFNGLTATGNYTLTKNADGTWTVVIHRGGGVTISAQIAARSIPEEEPEEVQVQAEAAPKTNWVHPAIGKTVIFGHYDFDGDGTAEGLQWEVVYVSGGYAKLALIDGTDGIPEDFEEKAFTDEEKEAIRDDEENGESAQNGKWIRELDQETAKRFFRDNDADQIHIALFVKLNAIDY